MNNIHSGCLLPVSSEQTAPLADEAQICSKGPYVGKATLIAAFGLSDSEYTALRSLTRGLMLSNLSLHIPASKQDNKVTEIAKDLASTLPHKINLQRQGTQRLLERYIIRQHYYLPERPKHPYIKDKGNGAPATDAGAEIYRAPDSNRAQSPVNDHDESDDDNSGNYQYPGSLPCQPFIPRPRNMRREAQVNAQKAEGGRRIGKIGSLHVIAGRDLETLVDDIYCSSPSPHIAAPIPETQKSDNPASAAAVLVASHANDGHTVIMPMSAANAQTVSLAFDHHERTMGDQQLPSHAFEPPITIIDASLRLSSSSYDDQLHCPGEFQLQAGVVEELAGDDSGAGCPDDDIDAVAKFLNHAFSGLPSWVLDRFIELEIKSRADLRNISSTGRAAWSTIMESVDPKKDLPVYQRILLEDAFAKYHTKED